MITLSTELFTYDAKSETFSTERSDLGDIDLNHSYIPSTSYRGISLKSHKTGAEITFSRMQDTYDNEKELQCINYRSLMMTKSGGHYTLHIFND